MGPGQTAHAAQAAAHDAARETTRAARELPLDTLAAMADDLAGRFALEPLLERILGHAMALLDCDSGSLCTVDEVAGTYRKEVDLGVGCQSGQTFPLDEGVTGEVARRRASVVFDEYADVPAGHIGSPERDSLHAVIGVPIRWDDTIIGACVLFRREEGRPFDGDDRELVELFARHAAIALTNARLHGLAAERASAAATMAERERVVRDVHDTVGRGLASVMLHLDDAAQALAAEATDARSALRSIQDARRSARGALIETRRTVLGLGPESLDGRSLREALALELSWARSTSSVQTRLVVVGDPCDLDPEQSRQLFRIAQESLTNVLEHARARSVRVGLVYGTTGVSLLIEDDGRGFDTTDSLRPYPGSPRLGLRGLAARAQHVGGTVQIDSTPGWGTRVRAELPYRATAADATSDEHPRWRVLVLHPNPIVRAGLVRMLALAEPDIQVVGEIADPAQAVDAYRLLAPHVLLAPLRMPHIDGVQLTSYVRAADPAAVVVLLVESVADDGVRHAAQGGAVGFVAHDADAATLSRSVVAAARGDSLMTAELYTQTIADGPDALTAREREVRTLLEAGLPYKAIATRLGISVKTVEKHVGAVLRKTGVATRAELSTPSRG